MYLESWIFPLCFGWPQRLIGSLTGTPRSRSSMSSALSMLMEAFDTVENCILSFYKPGIAALLLSKFRNPRRAFYKKLHRCQNVPNSFSEFLVSFSTSVLFRFLPWHILYSYQIYLYNIHEHFPSQTCAIARCFSRCWLEHCSAQSSPARLADDATSWYEIWRVAVVWNATKQPHPRKTLSNSAKPAQCGRVM